MASLHFRPLTRSEAEEVSRWVYEPPFDLYDGQPTNAEALPQQDSSGPLYYRISLRSEDPIVGFCCFSDRVTTALLVHARAAPSRQLGEGFSCILAGTRKSDVRLKMLAVAWSR